MLAALVFAGCATARPPPQPENVRASRCTPDRPCWPKDPDWQKLRASLTGKLEAVEPPLLVCQNDAASDACKTGIDSAQESFLSAGPSGQHGVRSEHNLRLVLFTCRHCVGSEDVR